MLSQFRILCSTLALLAWLVLSAAPGRGEATYIVAPWNGEYFVKAQGGFYLKVALNGFPASAQTKFLTGSVQVTAQNLLDKHTYVINHAIQDVAAAPRQIWKVPSGKYEIVSVVMVDTSGVKRTYRVDDRKSRQSFAVKRQCLANLGLWTLQPQGAAGLSLKLTMVPNSYGETGDKKDSSVAAVVDGFSGLIQEKLGGKRVLAGAKADYGGAGDLRATVTFTREISMFFKLDLMRHNSHAQAISQVLQVYDPNFRRCYMDRLEVNEALRGEVKFTFLLSHTTGTMAKIKNTGGSAGDPKLVQCLYYELAQIQFPVPENMIGELTYIYDVR